MISLGRKIIFTGIATWLAICAADAADDPQPKPANRLAKETSPYLLLHAHNPVDWYPWGPEAFAKAKKENKLVFLSIGYSSCHWCHVMERQSFNNPAIAKLMNDWFVCIKVDREERPEIDNIYLTALQVQGSHGGWPLSMFLLPDGKPLGGGTYWPPEDQAVEGSGEKAPGFKTILTKVHEDWQKRPERLKDLASRLAEGVQQALATQGREVVPAALTADLVQGALDAAKEEYDPVHGGFGNPQRGFRGPKFPQAPLLDFLAYSAERGKKETAGPMLTNTLDRMAMGGIYDQLGGGFHRYSTEREWKVPHFEKMLYDNAQLVSIYSRAFRLTKNPTYRRVVDETLQFIAREMTSPQGAFYSALDADSDNEEGKYYIWTADEIEPLLPKEQATLFKKVYGVDAGPNFEGKYNILFLAKPEEGVLSCLQPARLKLLQARSKRARPLLDTKVVTGWNGLMIAGYGDAAVALGEPRYAEIAERAAGFLLKNLRSKDGALLRTFSVTTDGQGHAKLNAYLEDYAFLVHGLLAHHDATGKKQWLDEAAALTNTMIDRYGDKTNGGFFFTSHDHEELFVRTKDQYDGATPCGNSMAALNLVRLAQKTGDARFAKEAERTLQAFGRQLQANPGSLNTMAQALATSLAHKSSK
jgi:uncharacterized protein YyaL (SSP411 family)